MSGENNDATGDSSRESQPQGQSRTLPDGETEQRQSGQSPQGQGEQHARQAPIRRDSLGDVISRPDTLNAVKNYGLGIAGAGLGVGVVGFLAAGAVTGSGDGEGAFLAAILSVLFASVGLLCLPLLGAPAGALVVRQVRRSEAVNYVEPNDRQIIATAALAGVVGVGVGSFLAAFLTLFGFDSSGAVGDLLSSIVGSAVAGGIAAAVGGYAEVNFGVGA